VSGALLRYRVMAYIVGVMLIVLVCVGVPLQYAASQPGVVKIVGPLHGFLYIIYLVAAFDLVRRARLSLWQLVAMIAAGLVPGLAFLVERVVTRRVGSRISASEASP
jgi:integral membrane protein